MENSVKTTILVLNSEQDAELKYGRILHQENYEFLYFSGHVIDPNVLMESLSPKLVLVSLEWLPQWRLLVVSAKKHDIPVLYVMDGVIEWTYLWANSSYIKNCGTCLQPLISDYLCVIGRNPARYLSTLGINVRLRVVGLPRLDDYDRTRTYSSLDTPKILIATANTYALNFEHSTYVRAALRDLKAFFSENPHVEPIWRIAPEVAEYIGVATLSDECSMEEQLRTVTGVISFCSTVVLESMLKDIPVCIVEYRAIPLLVSSAWQIRCLEHIEPVVKELLAPPEEKIAYQRTCLEDELEVGSASDRLLRVIELALNGNRSSEDCGRDYSGPLEYSSVHSQVSMFSVSSKTLLQYELDGCYKHIERTNNLFNTILSNLERNWIIKILRTMAHALGKDDLGIMKKLKRLAGRIQ